ncbi:MAG: hypothetical protein WC718_16915 [Phycisphaerales bacterium]|jgi:hypothetical protein
MNQNEIKALREVVNGSVDFQIVRAILIVVALGECVIVLSLLGKSE